MGAPTVTVAPEPAATTAPTATVAPGPAAATAPPAASGSVKTDREALVALYNATDGENWNESASANWLSDAPLGEWEGVTTNDDGRVVVLYLSNNFLSGEIPPELGSLSDLIVAGPQQQRLERVRCQAALGRPSPTLTIAGP